MWDNVRKKESKLDDLKREVEMDEHKISLQELYARLQTDPIKVL